MAVLIILFGSLIFISGILLLINPEIIFSYLRNNVGNTAIHAAAVLVRLVIGILLITQAHISKFPVVIELLGWFFIVAGVFLAVIGRSNFLKLMSWVLRKFKAFGRIGGAIAIAFGGFLIYAFL